MADAVLDFRKDPNFPFAAAFGAGLLAHAIFKRREPTLQRFLGLLSGAIALTVHSTRDFGQAAFLVLIGLTSLALSIAFYRLFLHDLASVPGPLLARLTQLHTWSVVVGGQTRKDMRALHAKYGDIVRIGPNELSVATPTEIMTVHGRNSWIKGASYNFTASGGELPGQTSLISLRTHEEHTQRRKVWDAAFHTTTIKDYQPIIRRSVIQFCEQTDREAAAGSASDLNAWFSLFVWDVMVELAYGGGGNRIKSGYDVDGAIDALCATLYVAGIVKVLPWAQPLYKLTSAGAKAKRFRLIATELFEKRYAKGNARSEKDVFYHLLGEGDDAKGKPKYSRAELAADSALVIAAGADTTRLVLTVLFLFMLREPSRYKKLQESLDEALDGIDFPTADQVASRSTPLLDAYLNETLRLSPPVPFANQREAPPGETLMTSLPDVNGHTKTFAVPGGTQVRFAAYAIHRDPRYWEDPESFRPERFLDAAGAAKAGIKRFDAQAFFPFLHGAYHCVGRNFAIAEMRLIVATLLIRYDMKLHPSVDTTAYEARIEDRGLLEVHEPLPVYLSLRKQWRS